MTRRWMMLVLVLGFGAAGASAARAADCATICDRNCTGPAMSSSEQSACAAQVQQCQQDCLKREGNAGPRVYGAFAYGPSRRAWAYSYGNDSADSAGKAALAGCQKNASDCTVVYNFSNTCAALAADEKKVVWAGANATQRGQAENLALTDCRRQYGNGCRVTVSACSLP